MTPGGITYSLGVKSAEPIQYLCDNRCPSGYVLGLGISAQLDVILQYAQTKTAIWVKKKGNAERMLYVRQKTFSNLRACVLMLLALIEVHP